jgi:hypothetical protein
VTPNKARLPFSGSIKASQSGLPDDLFSNQKKFGQILEYLGMEDVGIFYDHLEYFTAIWYILRPFGIFYGHLV